MAVHDDDRDCHCTDDHHDHVLPCQEVGHHHHHPSVLHCFFFVEVHEKEGHFEEGTAVDSEASPASSHLVAADDRAVLDCTAADSEADHIAVD